MEIIVWNVDTQNDFMNADGALAVPDAAKIRDNLSKIFKSAAKNNIPINGSADDHNEKSAEFAGNGGQFPDHCIGGTEGQLNIPETFLGSEKVGVLRWDGEYSHDELAQKLSKPQVILTKDDNDVFTNKYISVVLEKIPKNSTIYVIGVATEYCDRCAVVGLVKWSNDNNKNWTVAVVTDAIKEISEEGRARTFEEFKGLGVKFVTTSEVLKQINAKSSEASALKDAARRESRMKIR